MANTPKRKKLDKQPTDALPASKQKFHCCTCGTAYGKQSGNFSVSHSPMYRGTSYLAICYECVDSMFNTYRKELGGDRAAMQRMCMKLDLYWSNAIADAVDNTQNVNSYARSYLAKSNMKRYINKTYDDTINEEANGMAVPSPVCSNDVDGDSEQIVSDEILAFWGPGLSQQKYSEYEARLQYLKSKYPPGYEFGVGEDTLLRQLSAAEIENNYDRAAGRPTDKNTTIINTLVGSADLKPAQKKGGSSDSKLEGMPLGVGLQKWEFERPLPTTPDELRDVNGIIKNITVWFLGHLSKMVGLRNSYCQMYETAMEELRVDAQEYEEDDDETFLNEFLAGTELAGEIHDDKE